MLLFLPLPYPYLALLAHTILASVVPILGPPFSRRTPPAPLAPSLSPPHPQSPALLKAKEELGRLARSQRQDAKAAADTDKAAADKQKTIKQLEKQLAELDKGECSAT